ISPRTRSKTISVAASDPEGLPLSYNVEILVPADVQAAIDADATYGFIEYQPNYDNFYGLGEKHFLGAGGQKRFLLFSSGEIAELNYPYYYSRTTVSTYYYAH